MNKVITILLTIFMLFSYSQTSWSDYTVSGIGNRTCGVILERENTGQRGASYWQIIGWTNGYISGRNAEVDGKAGKNVDYKAIYFAVIKYCRDNPLKLYVESLNYVYDYQLK